MEYIEIKNESKTNPTFKFEKVGDKIEGVLVEKKTVTTSVGESKLYNIKKDDGTIFTVWGKPMLNDKMENVNVGDNVIIELENLKKVNGRPIPMKVYKVLVSHNDNSINIEDIDFDK